MNKYKFSNRIEGMPESIFASMSRLAVKHKAFNLGQGFPESDGPLWLMEAAFKAMKDGKNQYAPMNGTLSLRKNVSSMFEHYYGVTYNTDTEMTITAGATEGLYSTLTALLNPGDEVILFEPYYDSYYADIILAGAVPKFVTLKKPDFTFDFDELESEINSNTKMIVVNNPHNPCGKVFSKEELEGIAALAEKYDLLVLADEVYEFLTYDSAKHIAFASLEGMKERTISISSTGKTFSMTGWKIGWVLADSKITEAVQKVHQWAAFAVNTPGQHAMAFALTKLEDYLPSFVAEYTHKRNLAMKLLAETRFKAFPCFGSYFIMVETPDFKERSSFETAIELVEKHGVATIPTTVFYSKSDEGNSLLRICFAKNDDTLINGINAMKNY